jgi:translation initiation factor 1
MDADLLKSLDQINSFSSSSVSEKKIHLRTQQRNGKKCITTIQGLDDDLDIKRIAKAMRKQFNCNGTIEEHEQYGEIIQLQGDQRDNVIEWLIEQEILTKQEAEDRIVKHG